MINVHAPPTVYESDCQSTKEHDLDVLLSMRTNQQRAPAAPRLAFAAKTPTTAALQDLLVYAAKGISMYAHRAAKLGATRPAGRSGRARIPLRHGDQRRFRSRAASKSIWSKRPQHARSRPRRSTRTPAPEAGNTPETLTGPATWQPAADLAGLVRQGEEVGVTKRQAMLGPDVTGLQELILYGLKGAAAYADHAQILGHEDRDDLRHLPRGARFPHRRQSHRRCNCSAGS